MNLEYRIITLPAPLEARAADPEDEESVPGMIGHAAVYGQRALIAGLFVEQVEPGFFKPALRAKQDVRMLYNHNPDLLLARTKSKTLRLADDDIGLAVDADLPDTTSGRDLQVLLKRGDVDQMSFAWTTKEERWDVLPDDDPDYPGMDIRYLRKIDTLYDVSPVTFPAYNTTDAQLRSATELFEQRRAEGSARAANLEIMKLRLDLRGRNVK